MTARTVLQSLVDHCHQQWNMKDDDVVTEYSALFRHPEHGFCRYQVWRPKGSTSTFACVLFDNGNLMARSNMFQEADIGKLWSAATGATDD